jgi:glucose/arabinose dehydrogenase
LALPYGVSLAPDGSLVVTEEAGERVRRVTPEGAITTVAGTGEAGSSGDGGPATQAQLDAPTGVAVASDGTVYVAEQKGNRVRAIAPDGTIRTIAGTGASGFSGDGGKAAKAQLAAPTYLAIEPDGSLLVSDSGNDRVRRIDRSGVITTVAGGF